MDSSSQYRGNFAADVLLGRVTGVSRTSLFSYRNIATAFNNIGTPQDVWQGVNAEMTLATANESWEMVSTSALDTLGNTGAEAVSIVALDSARNQLATVQANLSGTTPVSLPGGATYYRLNNATTVGINNTGGRRKNQGDIIFRVADSAGDNTKVRGIIPAFHGGLCQAIYTAPINATTLIRALEVQMLGSGGGVSRGADFWLTFRNGVTGNVTAPRRIGTTDVRPYALDAHTMIRVPAGTDFIVQCVYTSQNSVTVSVSFEAHTYTL